MKAGVRPSDVEKVIVWENHSNNRFPDVSHATIRKGHRTVDAYTAVNDIKYLHGPFISTTQKRGAVIIQKRKFSSAITAAKAACDHMHDWHFGTNPGEWVSMAVPSDGAYVTSLGLVFSFPVTVDPNTKEYSVVWHIPVDFARVKLSANYELEQERLNALRIVGASDTVDSPVLV
ncbi:unnamed protein product [Heligmosomoides polygyrus]|uniref:Ldh_1_C domain-containing protein n=1 Tax=Heligmosomoides polygyrus TaxID=6339 RepID=A0A183G4P5_HELPZ|nr:unnamed protein product [Heligmosomoides polygyrus]